MAGREVAYPAFAIIVGPTRWSGGPQLSEVEAILIYGLEEDGLLILVVLHIVLLVGDGEVVDALGYGMIRILHLDLERADSWMSGISGAEDMAKVGIGQPHVGDIMEEQRRAPALDKLSNSFTLLGLHPELRFGGGGRNRRIGNDLHLAAGDPACIGRLVGIALRPDHSIAENNQKLVAIQRLGCEHLRLIAEVDGDAQILRDR